MELSDEQRQQAKAFLAKHLAAMGYKRPNEDGPTYKMNADNPETILKAVFDAHKFINPYKPTEN